MANPHNNNNHHQTLPTPTSKHSNLTQKNHPTTPNTTIHNLTNHLSKFQPFNPKPTNSQNPLPQMLIKTHFQAKPISKSANLEHPSQKFAKKVEKERQVFESEEKKSLKPTTMMCGNVKRDLVCGAKMELVHFLVANSAKVVSADMPYYLQIHAVGFARKVKDSLEKFSARSLALSLKKEFDGAYGPAWHCIVGTSFGSFVTHSVGGFLYFSLDQKVYILLFKTTVQRAD